MYSLINTDIFSPQIQTDLMAFAKGSNLVDTSFCSLGKDFSSEPQSAGLNPCGPKHMFKRFMIYSSWLI